MREIPVYITKNTDKIEVINAPWNDGLVHTGNFDSYIESICKAALCTPEEHLEISRNSNFMFGRKMRTASLILKKGEEEYSAESLYQGSKMFMGGGSNHYLYEASGDDALKTKSQWKGKKLSAVNFFGFAFPVDILSDLHDILYWTGLEYTSGLEFLNKSLEILEKNNVHYFTDSFDSPGKNSQSKSFAQYYWRYLRKETVWDFLNENQSKLIDILNDDSKQEEKFIASKEGCMKELF